MKKSLILATIALFSFTALVRAIDYNMDDDLISNGDAESVVDFQDWYHAAAPATVMNRTDSMPGGTSCFEMTNDHDAYAQGALRSLAFGAEAAEPMLLKFSYKTLPGFVKYSEHSLRADFRCFDASINYLGGNVILLDPTDGNWVNIEQEILVVDDSAMDSIDLNFSMNTFGAADGTVRFDNIQLFTARVSEAPKEYDHNNNLFANGDFETGDFTSWVTYSYVAIETVQVSGGSYSCVFTGNALGNLGQISHYPIDLTGQEFLLFECDFMSSVGTTVSAANTRMEIRFWDAGNGFIQAHQVIPGSTNGQWVTLSAEVEVPEGAVRLDVYTVMNADGPAYMDNMGIFPEAPRTYNMHGNIFNNGSFETGDLSSWQSFAGSITIDSTQSSDGNYSCLIDGTAGIAQLLHDAATPNADEFMLFSCDIKSATGVTISEAQTRLEIRIWDHELGAYTEVYQVIPTTTNGQWETFTSEFKVPAGADLVDVFTVMNADGDVYIDNMGIYPETTIAFDERVNLFDNGDFEYGDFSNWEPLSNVAIETVQVSGGSYSCGFTGNTLGTLSQIVRNGIDVTSHEKLLYKCDFMSAVGTTVSAANTRMEIRFYDLETTSYIGTVQVIPATTNGQWVTLFQELTVPAEADVMDVFVVMNADGPAYMDNMAIHPTTELIGPFDLDDLQTLSGQWLNDNRLPLLPDESLEDFESFASDFDMGIYWTDTSGVYANRGSGVLSLLTNPADAYSGSKALRWSYNNSNPSFNGVWTEFNRVLLSPVDFSQYDQLRFWVNRHPGNSQESLFYVKLINGEISEANIKAETQINMSQGSTFSPTGWTEVVINLDDMIYQRGATSKADLDSVVGFFFGVFSNDTEGDLGTGVIDLDEITLVNTVGNCGVNPPSMDLNDDCKVDIQDFATMAYFWLGV